MTDLTPDDTRQSQYTLDRKVVQAVGCPFCHSAKSWKCTSSNGKWTTPHSARYQMYRKLLDGSA